MPFPFFLRQIIRDALAWVPEHRFPEFIVKALDVKGVATSVAFDRILVSPNPRRYYMEIKHGVLKIFIYKTANTISKMF